MRLRRFAFFLCLLFSCGFIATGQAAVSITTTAFNPSTATVGVGYSANSAVTATGGQTPYSWSATGFPNGMSINSSSGAPFGTPAVAGTFNVNVTVRDSSNPQQTASKTLTLTVNSGSTPAVSITSTAFNPSTATVGVGYSANSAVSATGGQTPYNWSATGFPNGMSINPSSGAPFGTPTVAGTFNVNITVRDSSSPQKTASKTLTLTVNNASTPALSITSNAFNPSTATVGVGYSAQSPVTATGGQTPYSWSATGFPNGMSINSSTGAPFGTPTVAGTFNVNVTVRDSSSPQKTASKTLTLTVSNAGTSALSITSTAFNPPTATVGVGYGANSPVTAMGGQTPYDWSANGLPNGMGINSSSGAVFGTPTTAGTFNVNVTVQDSSSTQQATSKVLTLTVNPSGSPVSTRPDLVPSNVMVTPSSFTVGDLVTVSLTVANQGEGPAPQSITRIRINSSPATTTAGDFSLGDIDTPAIPPNSSVPLETQVRISGIPPGTYYVWVSLDNGKATDQTDGTNDYAHSQALSISGLPGAGSPLIQSINQTGNSDGTVRLSVSASGNDLRYQWYRDYNFIAGATNPSWTARISGTYWVIVSNGGDAVQSQSESVLVQTAGGGESTQPSPGQATWIGRIDPNLPTVVITHGWQPFTSYGGVLPSWVELMGDEIKERLTRAEFPESIDGQRANIIFFSWPEAYTIAPKGLLYASSYTDAQGAKLAAELERLLGSNYSQDIQFIGHSLGTIVNGYAVGKFPHGGRTQFTVLDAPLKFTYYSQQFFQDHLSSVDVTWVDNYIATRQLSVTPGVGQPITGAALNGGYLFETDHSGIHKKYRESITTDSSTAGFYNSVLLGLQGGFDGNDRPAPQVWRPTYAGSNVEIAMEIVAHLPEIAEFGFKAVQGEVRQTADSVRGTVRQTIRMVTNWFDGNSSMRTRTASASVLADSNPGSSAISVDIAVPANASRLTFDYQFPSATPGDWITVTFNETLLYSFPAESFVGSEFRTAEMPVREIAGQTGVLVVRLNSGSDQQTEVAVSNFQFSAIAPASPSKLANISTRLGVGIGDNAMIGGFIITGTQPKTVVVRGIGPSLGGFGIQGALADPVIEVYDGSGVLRGTNDNWNDAQTRQQIIDSGLAPAWACSKCTTWIKPLIPSWQISRRAASLIPATTTS